MLAFGMAVRNPNFNQMATKAAKNLEDLCASVPGLDKDPVACAFLSKVGRYKEGYNKRLSTFLSNNSGVFYREKFY